MSTNKISELTFKKEVKPFNIAFFAALGSGLEYYDFVIYGIMVKYLSDIFFSSTGGLSGSLLTFAIFTIGYLARPFGGTIVGMISDTYGRKKTFVLVMFTMAFSTTAIGLLPTYEQVGVVAPLALLVLRVLQGFSFGAEMPGATTIVSEFSPKNKLGILSSMVLSSTVLGSVCATGILALLTHFCTHQEIINGYWRVPFLIGGMLAIVAYFIRRSITETPEFTDHKTSCGEQKMLAPLAMLIKGHFGKLMMGFSMTLFLATNIIINISFPAYIHQYFSYPLADIYLAMTISLMVSFLFMLIFGFLSDHIAKLKMLLGCLVIWAISLSPLFQLLHTGTFWALQLFLIINQLCIAVFFTNYIPILPRLFPINIRYTAVALGYNVGFSIASAIPMTASYFLEQIQPSTTAFYFLAQMNPSITLQLFYVVPLIMALVSVILLMIQTKGKGYVW